MRRFYPLAGHSCTAERPPVAGVQLLKTCHPPCSHCARLVVRAIGTTAGIPPKVLPERRKLQPGEGQGEPVNAALAWLRRSCRPRVRWPGSVRQSGESYQTALCCGRAKLSPELQPSPSGNPRQGAREQGGQVSRMEIYKGCSASEARQAVGSNSSVVNIRTRRAVHTFTVWSGMLSSTGKRHALCA